MLLITTPDGTHQVSVSREKLSLVRAVLDLDLSTDDLEALKRLLSFGPERIRALHDLAQSQLALEHVLEEPAQPRQLPMVQGGRLVYPIACPARVNARRRGEEEPICTWKHDTCGSTCETCGRWEGAEMGPRGAFIANRFAAGAAEQ